MVEKQGTRLTRTRILWIYPIAIAQPIRYVTHPGHPTIALCHGAAFILECRSPVETYHPTTQTDSKMRRQTFRTSSNMASHPPEKSAQTNLPHRQGTDSSLLSDDAVPTTDPRDVSVATFRPILEAFYMPHIGHQGLFIDRGVFIWSWHSTVGQAVKHILEENTNWTFRRPSC